MTKKSKFEYYFNTLHMSRAHVHIAWLTLFPFTLELKIP